MNFICIPLTSSFMHQEKSTISCSPRQEGAVRSPLTKIPLWPSPLGCWGGTCQFESKCSACYWARFSMCADQDLSLASHRWFKRDNWETLGRGCLLQEAIPSLTMPPYFVSQDRHWHTALYLSRMGSISTVWGVFWHYFCLSMCYLRIHSAVRCAK